MRSGCGKVYKQNEPTNRNSVFNYLAVYMCIFLSMLFSILQKSDSIYIQDGHIFFAYIWTSFSIGQPIEMRFQVELFRGMISGFLERLQGHHSYGCRY